MGRADPCLPGLYLPNMKRVCLAVLVLVLLIACAVPITPCLEVRSRGGRLLFGRPVKLHERVTLNYIHSVARRPVDEVWEVASPGVLILRETIYDSFGAGLPADLAPGEALELKDGRLRISGMDRRLPVVGLAVGRTAEHTLIFAGGSVRLADVSPPGSLVEIRVARRSMAIVLWQYLAYRRSLLEHPTKGGSQNG